MWSILAEAIAINRQLIAIIPAGCTDDQVAERLGQLRRQAWHLGINLEHETRWLPPADMTPEQAEADLVKIRRSLCSLDAYMDGKSRTDETLIRQYEDLRAYRDRLEEVVRGECT